MKNIYKARSQKDKIKLKSNKKRFKHTSSYQEDLSKQKR